MPFTQARQAAATPGNNIVCLACLTHNAAACLTPFTWRLLVRKRAFAALLIVLSAMAFCLPAMQAQAGPVLDRIQKNGVLVVGTDPSYPPLSAKAVDGEIIGYEIDLARFLAAALKVKLQLKEVPFNYLLPALGKGEVDLVMAGLTITPGRNAKYMFAGPHLVAGQSVLTTRELAINLQGPASLNQAGITVAAAKGTTGEMAVKELLPKAKYIQAETQEAALRLVLAGKAKAAIADFPYCAVASFRYRDKGIVTTEKPFTFEPLGIAMSQEDPLLHNLVQNFLLLLQGSGRMEEMQNRWFKKSGWIKRLPK
jgi:ABC-type amino acid transport substrate-binding protein